MLLLYVRVFVYEVQYSVYGTIRYDTAGSMCLVQSICIVFGSTRACVRIYQDYPQLFFLKPSYSATPENSANKNTDIKKGASTKNKNVMFDDTMYSFEWWDWV